MPPPFSFWRAHLLQLPDHQTVDRFFDSRPTEPDATVAESNVWDQLFAYPTVDGPQANAVATGDITFLWKSVDRAETRIGNGNEISFFEARHRRIAAVASKLSRGIEKAPDFGSPIRRIFPT